MTDVTVLSMANISLSFNFRNAGLSLGTPDTVWGAWQPHATQEFRTPFSELKDLEVELEALANAGRPDATATLVVLGGDCIEYASAPVAPGTGERHRYEDYLAEYVKQQYGLRVSCEIVSLGRRYLLTNNSPDLREAQAAIMHVAAELHQSRAWDQTKVVVNTIGGANEYVDALKYAGRFLGWKVEDGFGIGRAAEHSSVVHQWGLARSLVDEVADEIKPVRRLAKPASREDLLRAAFTTATNEGLLAFVAPGQDGDGRTLQMSDLGTRLFQKAAGGGRTYFSATQWMLAGRLDVMPPGIRPDTDRVSERLGALVEGWGRADLFGSNQVSELVAHGESHCEAVDRNIASITRPLLLNRTLDAEDVFHLAVAAWLHDWGHSAAAFSTDPKLAAVSGSSDIRQVHGLLSRERLKLEASGLTDDERVVPGLIIAHHQGWTSLDGNPPTAKNCLSGTPYMKSLAGDLADARLRPRVADKIPLLIAIFRLADASDMGQHRAFYEDVLRDRLMDEFSIELERAALRHSMVPADVEGWRNRVRAVLYEGDAPNASWPSASGADKHLCEYAKLCVDQRAYFLKHSEVAGVHLRMKPIPGGWHLVPVVTPAYGGSKDKARETVTRDMQRELNQDPVRSLLQGVGIWVEPATLV